MIFEIGNSLWDRQWVICVIIDYLHVMQKCTILLSFSLMFGKTKIFYVKTIVIALNNNCEDFVLNLEIIYLSPIFVFLLIFKLLCRENNFIRQGKFQYFPNSGSCKLSFEIHLSYTQFQKIMKYLTEIHFFSQK